MDEQQQLVVGSPADLAYETGKTEIAPELAFYSQATDAIFYTTLVINGTADRFDGFSWLQQSSPVSPYVEFTQPGLRRLSQSLGETSVWKDNAYAYARLQQSADGALYFARISDSKALYAAFTAGTITVETVERLRPTVDVLRLSPRRTQPEVWLTNATQFTLAPEFVSPTSVSVK